VALPGNFGEPLRISRTREESYPSYYSLPEVRGRAMDSIVTVIPAAPTKFKKVSSGWLVEVTAKKEKSFIVLEGRATHKTVKNRVGVFGEASQPVVAKARGWFSDSYVVITENRGELPAVSTVGYPFQIRAFPGKDYALPVTESMTLTFRVD